MEEEKHVVGQLDGAFLKTKELVSKIIGSMDTMLVEDGTSMCCYIAIFTLIMVALLVRFG